MKFLAPQWLWLLLAVPPLFWLALRDEKRRQDQFARFADRAVWRTLVPEMDSGARIRKFALWLAALAFAVLALARPQWGSHEEVVHATGLDIMVVLDVSNSMETEDVAPSRLKKARHMIRTMTEKLKGDRVGMVAFAASSYVACPLTTDVDYLLETAQILGPRMVSNQGTDIGLGLDTARKALERGAEEIMSTGSANSGEGAVPVAGTPQASHVVILISDGEDQEQGALEAATTLKSSGAKVYVIGIGTEKGGPVPVRDEAGGLQGYKKDRQGKPVVSAFHPDALMQVAQAAGGRYFNATADEAEIDEMLQDMGALNRTDYAERRYLVYEDRFQFPLAVAIFLLLLEISYPVRKIRKLKVGAAALVLFLSQTASAASLLGNQPPLQSYLENERGLKAFKDGKGEEAQKKFGAAQALDPTLPELQFNQGVVQMGQSDFDHAAQGFSEAAKGASERGETALAGKSLYNLGGALAKKGDIKGAVQSYLSAIQAAQQGKDVALEEDARKNLQLLIQERQKQKQQEKEKKDKQDKDGSDKKDGKDGKDDKDKKDKDKKEDQAGGNKNQAENEPKQYQDPSKSKKQKFQSPKLTNEDAERVMSELSSRERELQAKLKKQRGTPQQGSNAKDW